MVDTLLINQKRIRKQREYSALTDDQVGRINSSFMEAAFLRARYFSNGHDLTEREAIMVKCFECIQTSLKRKEISCPDNTCPLYQVMFDPVSEREK